MSKMAILPPSEDGFARKKWSVDECRFLTNSGLLEPGKFELIEGEIIFKMGQSLPHMIAVTYIVKVLAAIFGNEALIHQSNVGFGERDEFSDPEPDVTVVRGEMRDYVHHMPDPSSDILLIVEAAHTSLPGDTTVKAKIYARHGVPEYWVVSTTNRELIVYRLPLPDGYVDIRTFTENDRVSPLAATGYSVLVADMLA